MLFLSLLSAILGIIQVSCQMSVISPFSDTISDPLSTVPSPYFDISYPKYRGFFHRRNRIYSPHTYESWSSPHNHAMILHRSKHAQRNHLLQNPYRADASEHDRLATHYCNVSKRICKDFKPSITKFNKHKKCTCKKEKSRNKYLSKKIRKMRKALKKERLKLENCMNRLDRERYSRLRPKSLKNDANKHFDKIKTSIHELPMTESLQNQKTRSKSCSNCTSHHKALKSSHTLHNAHDNDSRSISKESSYKLSNQSTNHYRHGKKYKHYNHKRKHKRRKLWSF